MDEPFDNSQWLPIAPGGWHRAEPPGPVFQFDDPVSFEWNTYRLQIEAMPPALHGLRIVHLSDIHCRVRWKQAYDELNDRLAVDPPDLLMFTGDLIDDMHHPRGEVAIARRLVSGWVSRLGAFGIRGNHDRVLPLSRFTGSRLKFIEGQCIVVQSGGAELELIGLPGPDRIHLPPSFASAMPKPRIGVPRVVLSHYPDHIRWCDPMRPDIFLAGHTHGGQCSLPGVIPLIRHDALPWPYTRGVHRYRKSWLVVSRGFGFTQMPIRIFCPAEVTELILVAKSSVDGTTPTGEIVNRQRTIEGGVGHAHDSRS